jgi:hypothetical protein
LVKSDTMKPTVIGALAAAAAALAAAWLAPVRLADADSDPARPDCWLLPPVAASADALPVVDPSPAGDACDEATDERSDPVDAERLARGTVEPHATSIIATSAPAASVRAAGLAIDSPFIDDNE